MADMELKILQNFLKNITYCFDHGADTDVKNLMRLYQLCQAGRWQDWLYVEQYRWSGRKIDSPFEHLIYRWYANYNCHKVTAVLIDSRNYLRWISQSRPRVTTVCVVAKFNGKNTRINGNSYNIERKAISSLHLHLYAQSLAWFN